MPRRNNRKRRKGEGTLGFNPDKYIGSSRHRGRDAPRYIIKVSQDSAYDYKPSKDRHKAHAPTERTRRAMNDIRQMQRTAARVPPLDAPAVHFLMSTADKPTITLETTKVATQEVKHTEHNLGGIISCLKRKLLPA